MATLGQIENHMLDSFTVSFHPRIWFNTRTKRYTHPRYMVQHREEEIHTLKTTQTMVEGVIIKIIGHTIDF